MVGVRMPEELQDAIRAWAKKQSDRPALAPAIRRLVELGLTVRFGAKQSAGQRAWASVVAGEQVGDAVQERKARSSRATKRAAELASNEIEKHGDPSAAPKERADRRRRIIEGPSIVRDVRKDRSK